MAHSECESFKAKITNFQLNPYGRYFYYAFGNTPMVDLMSEMKVPAEITEFLLLGCGDIRNVLKTVAENESFFKSKVDGMPQLKQMSFHMNDQSDCILARNSVLLKIIQDMDPKLEEDLDFLWNVWYNLSLSKPHKARLDKILTQLLEDTKVGCQYVHFGNKNTEKLVHDIWNFWLKTDKSTGLQYIQSLRRRDLTDRHHEQCPGDTSFFDDEFKAACQFHFKHVETELKQENKKSEEFSAVVKKELEEYMEEGSTAKGEMLNTTLLTPGSIIWMVYYKLIPFMNFAPINSSDLSPSETLTQHCKKRLQQLIRTLKRLEKKDPGFMKVTLWHGDAISVCSTGLPKDLTFDFIDTSNLADHVGLLNILCSCTGKLRSSHSVLTTSTMKGHNAFRSISKYLEVNLGISPLLMPTLLGLHLADDLDLGRNTMESSSEMTHWTKVDHDISTMTIDTPNSDLKSGLQSLLSRCCVVEPTDKDEDTLDCGNLSASVATFWQIVKNLQERTQSKWISDLYYVAYKLLLSVTIDTHVGPHAPLKMTSDAITYLHGMTVPGISNNDQLLKVVFTLDIEEVVPEYIPKHVYNLLNMVLMIFECKEDLKRMNSLSYKLLNGIILEGPVHIFQNFMYNQESKEVAMFVLESAWNKLPDRSVIVVVSKPPRVPIRMMGITKMDVHVTKMDFPNPKMPVYEDEAPFTELDDMKVDKIEETEVSYFVTVRTKQRNKAKVDHKVSTAGRSHFFTQLEMALHKENTPRLQFLIVSFSCPIYSKKEIKFYWKQGRIEVKLKKMEEAIVGSSRLPLRLIDMNRLAPITNARSVKEWIQYIPITGVDYDTLSEGKPVLATFNMFQNALRRFFMFLWLKPNVCTHAVELLLDPKSKKQHCQLALHIQKLCWYNGYPILFVQWIDFQLGLSLRDSGVISSFAFDLACDPAVRFWTNNLSHINCEIVTDSAPVELLTKFLKINSKRVDQPKQQPGVPQWCWNSYIQLRFRQSPNIARYTNLPDFNDLHHGELSFCAMCNGISHNQIQCDCGNVSYCDVECQTNHWPMHKDVCMKTLGKADNMCSNCNRISVDLKTCTGCQEIKYCSKKCQKKHWKIHQGKCAGQAKTDVPKNSNPETGKSESKHKTCTPTCTHCNTAGDNLKKCTRCSSVSYCSKECQRADWKEHKNRCCSQDTNKSMSDLSETKADIKESIQNIANQPPNWMESKDNVNKSTTSKHPNWTMSEDDVNKSTTSNLPNWANSTGNVNKSSTSKPPNGTESKDDVNKNAMSKEAPVQTETEVHENESTSFLTGSNRKDVKESATSKQPPSSARSKVRAFQSVQNVVPQRDKLGGHASGGAKKKTKPDKTDSKRQCSNCNRPSDHLRKCTGCGIVGYCGKGCQEFHWKEHKTTCTGVENLLKETRPDAEEEACPLKMCAGCCQKGSDLKKCTRCHLVAYCSKKCQQSHWKLHRNQCTSSEESAAQKL